MKALTKQQRQFVRNVIAVILGTESVNKTQAAITTAQWPECDPEIAQGILDNVALQREALRKAGKHAEADVCWLKTKISQRSRAGWSKLTFFGEDDALVAWAWKRMERARVKIERNNGYVVEAAKKDVSVAEAKRLARMTDKQFERTIKLAREMRAAK
jgi:hypothetical protein